METRTLIDMAAKVAQSKQALARMLGVSPQRVSEWAHGHRPCPLEVQVALCDVAGLNDHESREHLREAAKVPSPKQRAGALASIALALVVGAVSAAASTSSGLATMYIM